MYYLSPVKNTETLWVLKSSHLYNFYHLCEHSCWYKITLICGTEARCKLGYFDYFDALFFVMRSVKEIEKGNWWVLLHFHKQGCNMSFTGFYCLIINLCTDLFIFNSFVLCGFVFLPWLWLSQQTAEFDSLINLQHLFVC